MFNKLKSFLHSDFYNRYKIFISRIVYVLLCFVIFFLCCTLIDNESIDYLLSLPIGYKIGTVFLIYIFLAPPTMNDVYQDEQFNCQIHQLADRIKRLESCAFFEEGADIGEDE